MNSTTKVPSMMDKGVGRTAEFYKSNYVKGTSNKVLTLSFKVRAGERYCCHGRELQEWMGGGFHQSASS